MIRPARQSALLALCVLFVGCDVVFPATEPLLVVETYVAAGPELPPVHVRSTHGLSANRQELLAGVTDAYISFTLNGQQIPYEHVENGRYEPAVHGVLTRPIAEGDVFTVGISRGDQHVEGGGRVPPRIRLTSTDVRPAERAIPAVLVDSLDIGLDSLDLGLDAAQGFIFPVEVDMTWDGLQPGLWVETQLSPEDAFSSSVLDFFLLPNAVQPEARLPTASWRGVYAVPVETAESAFPIHELLIGIARGDSAFAAFASGRIDSSTRTPTSNVSGGLGFIGGVAVDTVRISIGQR